MSSNSKLETKKMHPEAILPTRAHPDDAGLDLYCLEDFSLGHEEGKVVRTGVAFAIPQKHVGLVADRSSMAKRGLKTSGGIIDAGYRGEVHIIIWNLSGQTVEIKKAERIAQLLIMPIITPEVVEVRELDETSRGIKGFGSSGR